MKKESIKIIQLIDSLEPGGAERMTVNLANEFSKIGIQHKLVVSRREGGLADLLQDKGVLQVLRKKNTLDLKAFILLKRIVKKFNPDIIHAHGTSIYWAWALKKIFPKVVLIWHDHLGISQDVIEKNPRKEMRWLIKSVDLIITANQDTQKYWQNIGVLEDRKIAYLSNFPAIALRRPKLPANFTFLHLANFRAEKGHISLVKAVQILKDEGFQFKVRMVGKEVDASWKSDVSALIKKMHLEDTISLEAEVGDVGAVLSKVHAGMVVSDREGLPVALLEYGLAGLPVVSTRVGQCPEVLGFGDFGVLVETGDPSNIAEGMKILLKDTPYAEDLGKRLKSHIGKNYGSEGFMNNYFQLISILEKS